MRDLTSFFIGGDWVKPVSPDRLEIEDPATGTAFAVVSLGGAEDVDRAVAAAKAAQPAWARSSREDRLAALERLQAIFEERIDEMAEAIRLEMGAPLDLARSAQARYPGAMIGDFADALRQYRFCEPNGETDMLWRVPVGVCALITPWNWPMDQVALKVLPALATGNTVVLKPSEVAPVSAMLFARMIDAAGFPPGSFNLVNGTGEGVGAALTGHGDVDLVSFTGSTRAGRAIGRNAADTVKRVVLELGGKGANIVFADADAEAVERGTRAMFHNSGQNCNAPSRMLVERSIYDAAVKRAVQVAESTRCGPTDQPGDHIGPLVSAGQWDRVQELIGSAQNEGARIAAGGQGKPDGCDAGHYARPTIIADVSNDMRVAREEIFGPVLCMIPFDTEEEAIAIANDTPYGLSNYVQTADPARAARVAAALRSGMVRINGVNPDRTSPFGGVKQSGTGREGGRWGLDEFVEIKSVSGL